MRNLLFILPYCPFPPRHGGQIAVWNRLRSINKAFRISVICPRPPDESIRDSEFASLENIQFLFFNVGRRTSSEFYRDVIFKQLSSVEYIYRNSDAGLVLEKALLKPWDVVLCEHCYTLRWALSQGIRSRCERLLLVEQNAEHLVALDAARYSKISLLRRFAFRFESFNLRSIIRQSYPSADRIIFISDADARSCSQISAIAHSNICNVALPTPTAVKTNFSSTRVIVFFATIGYFPNLDGVRWFITEILPAVRRRVPGVRFRIVVTSDSDNQALLQSGLTSGVEILAVSSLADADRATIEGDVFVSPIRLGSGIKMKNIIALGLGMPIVASDQSWRGILGANGTHVSIATNASTFASQIVDLLNNEDLRRSIGQAARQLFLDNYTIQSTSHQWVSAIGGK